MSSWQSVCALDQVPVERGVAALLDGEQVALFRTPDGALHAVSNQDPFSGAMVLSRGIVGSRGDRPVVLSPMFKQAFDLETGRCLDDATVSVAVFDVREHQGLVEVATPEQIRRPA